MNLLLIAVLCTASDSCFPQASEASAKSNDEIQSLLPLLQHPERLPPDMAQEARSKLAAFPAEALPRIVEGMHAQKLPALNWLRSAGDEIVERELAAGHPLPIKMLDVLARDRQIAGPARRIALAWCDRGQPGFRDAFLRQHLDDPVFVADAVEAVDLAAAAAENAGQEEQAKQLLTAAFRATVDPDQASRLARRLEEFDVTVDVHRHLGMVTQWHAIGPFAGQDQRGAATAFPPETHVDLTQSLAGRDGEVKWTSVELAKGETFLDLRKSIAATDDAVAYLTATVRLEKEQEVEILGGADDNLQVWVNGQKVINAPEYYQRPRLDKHRAKVTLPAGDTRLLAKVCEVKLPPGPPSGSPPRWQFSLRIVDRSGHGLMFQPAP